MEHPRSVGISAVPQRPGGSGGSSYGAANSGQRSRRHPRHEGAELLTSHAIHTYVCQDGHRLGAGMI
jgi:hypothetical protein